MPPRKAAKPAAPPSDEIRSSPPAAEPVKPKRAPASKKRVVVASEDEDDAPGEPLVAPELNEADHTHKPMTTDAFHRTAGLARDLKEQASRYTAGVETLSRAAADLIEASGGELSEARAKALADIELKIRRLLDRAHDARLAMEAITDIRNRLGRNEAITHAYDDFETQLVDPRAEYAGKTSRQRYAEAEPYVDYRTTIWVRWRSARRRTDLQNADKTKAGGMPSVKSLIPTEEGDDSDDDDIEVGGTTQQLLCPISLATMEEPMKNDRCPHRVDRMSAEEYYKPRSTPKACPVAGCSNRILFAELTPDAKMARDIQIAKRREREREDERREATTVAVLSDSD